jgi:hypothetical protein
VAAEQVKKTPVGDIGKRHGERRVVSSANGEKQDRFPFGGETNTEKKWRFTE